MCLRLHKIANRVLCLRTINLNIFYFVFALTNRKKTLFLTSKVLRVEVENEKVYQKNIVKRVRKLVSKMLEPMMSTIVYRNTN